MSSSSSTTRDLTIEQFSLKHNRGGFSCGNSYIDAKLHRSVLPLQDLGMSRAFVAVKRGTNTVLGFYAMNNHEIEVWSAPEAWSSTIRTHDVGAIPAAYISLFATREMYQGRGIGRMMMADALRRIKLVSNIGPGVFAVTLDAIDQKAFDFYAKIGFQGFDGGLRMFYLVSAIA